MKEVVKVTVVSKSPPGGRCELYDRMFFEAVKGFSNVQYCLVPSNLFEVDVTPPAVLVNGRLIEPEDGIMLTPDELVKALLEAGGHLRDEGLKEKLSKIYEEFVGGG